MPSLFASRKRIAASSFSWYLLEPLPSAGPPAELLVLLAHWIETWQPRKALSRELEGISYEVLISYHFCEDWKWFRTSFKQSSNRLDGMKSFERELQELLDEVKRLIMMGNKNDGIDLLQANYEAVKERMNAGVRGIEEAATIDIIALGYMAIGDLKFVDLNEVVDSLKDGEPLLDSVLVHMGSMYSTLGKFEKSMSAYRRAVSNMENIYGKNSVFLTTPILGMAKVLSSIRRTSKAVESYNCAITLLESSRGAESEDLVIPLLGLGNLEQVHPSFGDWAKA